MARTVLSTRRLTEVKLANIGRIIIFCEGKTEKYYFEYFADIINRNKYTEVNVVLESAGGNAQAVLNFAKAYFALEENNQRYSTYGKYLAYDCDSPPNIQAVILASLDYQLLISNPLFETWLLMHFEEVDVCQTKRQTYRKLSEYLHSLYQKGHKGIVREIIQNGEIEKAIDNARRLEEVYSLEDMSAFSSIMNMNPFTTVYRLIEQFMAEIS